MDSLNNFSIHFTGLGFLGTFVLVYLVIWLLIAYITHEKVERINKKIQERNKYHKKP